MFLERVVQADVEVGGVEVEATVFGFAAGLGIVVGTVISEESEVRYDREVVGDVDGDAGLETNLVCNGSLGLVKVLIGGGTDAESYGTVNEQSNQVVAGAEVCEAGVGVDGEQIKVGIG